VLFNDSLDLSGGEVNGPCVQLRSRRCYTYALLAIGMSAQTKQFSYSILGPTFVAFWVFHIAIRKDAEAVLPLMNSTGRLEVDRRLCSTTAITLCSRVASSSARILDFSSSVRVRVRCRSSLEFSSAILSQ
jgi:hypothetical protein